MDKTNITWLPMHSTASKLFSLQKFSLHIIYIQGIFQLFHACDSRTLEAGLFQSIFKFCTFLPKFSNILPFFALFLKNCTHLPFFLQQALISHENTIEIPLTSKKRRQANFCLADARSLFVVETSFLSRFSLTVLIFPRKSKKRLNTILLCDV